MACNFLHANFFRHIAKINDLLNMIAKAFEGVTGTSNEYAELREAKANFEELQRRWNDALADAAETFNGAQGAQNAENAKNSMRKSAKSVYNSTDTQYNSVTKKLVAAGILSVNDQKLFHQKVSELRNLGYQSFQKSRDGEYIFAINNKLVYTDANFDAPGISKIIAVKSEFTNDFEFVKELIYDYEKGKSGYEETIQFMEIVLEETDVVSYTRLNGNTYAEQIGIGEGRNRRGFDGNYRIIDLRGGNDSENGRNLRGTDAVKERYSLRKSTDTEYAELAKDPEKNAARLNAMVEAAAKEAGYDSPLLYHGTQSFGFTNFDLSKMDDGRSIFLTSSPEIASTYSGVGGSRRITDRMIAAFFRHVSTNFPKPNCTRIPKRRYGCSSITNATRSELVTAAAVLHAGGRRMRR